MSWASGSLCASAVLLAWIAKAASAAVTARGSFLTTPSARSTVALRHAFRRIGEGTVKRTGMAQSRFGEPLQSFDRAREFGRRQRHQHLVIGDAAIAPLGIAGDGKARLSRLERVAPGIGAGALAGDREVVALVGLPLQAIDEEDHLPGRAVEERDIRRIEPRRAQWRDDQRIVPAGWHPRHVALMRRRGVLVLEPDAGHALAGEKI